MTITKRFLDSIRDFSSREFDEDIIGRAKECLIDYFACTYMGARQLGNQESEWMDQLRLEPGRVSVIGLHRTCNILEASLLNGINAHQVELDDGHRFAMIHLGAPIISALIAEAQDQHLSGVRLLQGIIVSYEATVRLASAIQPQHKLRGYHTTATCTTVGTALGLAVMSGLPYDRWNAVITAAATGAAGLLEAGDNGSELKPYNAGQAAVSAVNALRAGRLGLEGPPDILGGPRGFFKAMAGEVNEELLLHGNMPSLAIEGIYRKPYASCRHSHAPIEGALDLRKRYQLDPDRIIRVFVDTYDLAVKGHDHTEITGSASAKMSIPYGVATALTEGKVDFSRFEQDHWQDKDILKLSKKILVREDAALSAQAPGKRAARVTIELPDGNISCMVDHPLGEPENPMSSRMLEEKYRSMMAAADVPDETAREILICLYDIEKRFDRLLEII